MKVVTCLSKAICHFVDDASSVGHLKNLHFSPSALWLQSMSKHSTGFLQHFSACRTSEGLNERGLLRGVRYNIVLYNKCSFILLLLDYLWPSSRVPVEGKIISKAAQSVSMSRRFVHNLETEHRVTWGKAPPRGKAPLPSNYEFTYASGSIS